MLRASYKSILFRKAFRFKACLGKPIIPAPGDKDDIGLTERIRQAVLDLAK